MDETNAQETPVEQGELADQVFSEEEELAGREWDEQIARDLRAGRLDVLINQAKADYAAGRYWEVTEKGLSSNW